MDEKENTQIDNSGTAHEVTPPGSKEPWKMTYVEFKNEYEAVMAAVAAKERKGGLDPADRTSYRLITKEEQQLLDADWKAFSRQRGFTDDDIAEYERWLCLSGQLDRLVGAINDPWRRSRAGWERKLYKMHIERALQNGERIPDAASKSYESMEADELHELADIMSQSLVPGVAPAQHDSEVW